MQEVVSQIKEENEQLSQDNRQLLKDNQQLSNENQDLSLELNNLVESSQDNQQLFRENQILSKENQELFLKINNLVEKSQDCETSLASQRERYEKRHKSILQSSLLEQNTKFNNILSNYCQEINRLNLVMESKTPNVSQLDYKTHGLDLRKSTNPVVPSDLNVDTPSVSHYRDKLKRLRQAGGLSNND